MGFFKSLALSLAALTAVDAASLLNVENKKDIIKDAYIVVMKDGVSAHDFSAHTTRISNFHHARLAKRGNTKVGGLKSKFDIKGWRGYSGSFDKETLDNILKDSKVAYVEPDRKVKVAALTEQKNAPSWGLGRVSHKSGGSPDYVYDDSAGEGVTFYGVDTGIDINHPDFEGRAEWGTNTVDSGTTDGHGHGTHTAGTVAGASYGLAKKAKLVAVKVLDDQGSGAWSAVISGMDWCVSHAKQNNALDKAVMNVSIGGEYSAAVNSAATNAQNAGIFVAVAAGNDNVDAGNVSPASAEAICTVGATDQNDGKASFSNFGSVLEIYAPGVDIISTMPGGSSGPMSGTSMATPHVAGVGAYLIALEGIGTGQVCGRIQELANEAVSNPGPGTTSLLLYNGSGK